MESELDLQISSCAVLCGSLFVLFRLAIVLSILLWFPDSDYPFGIFKLFFVLFLLAIVFSILLWSITLITALVSFGHRVVYPSLIYGLWLPLWYLFFFYNLSQSIISNTPPMLCLWQRRSWKSNQMEFSEVRVSQSFCIVVCISLFVILSFLFWPLYWCLQTFEKNVYAIQQMSTASVA